MMTDADILEWLRGRMMSLGTRCYSAGEEAGELDAILTEMDRVSMIANGHCALREPAEPVQIHETAVAVNGAHDPNVPAIEQEDREPPPPPAAIESVRATLRSLQDIAGTGTNYAYADQLDQQRNNGVNTGFDLDTPTVPLGRSFTP